MRPPTCWGSAPEDLVKRDATSYYSGSGEPFYVAQVEVVGRDLMDRKDELLEAMQRERSRQGSRSTR